MAVGTWAELTTSNIGNCILSANNAGGVGGNNIPYANHMAWSPFTRQIKFVGSDHNAGYMPEITYDEAMNAWSVANAGGAWPAGTHAYAQFWIRPDTGDMYSRYNGGGIITEPAYRKLAGGSWATLPATTKMYTQIGVGAAYWPGSNSGVTGLKGKGAGGCYLIFECTFGDIACFDAVAGTWEVFNSGFTTAPADPYQTFGAYSKVKNCAIYGGGGGYLNKVLRLNQDKSVTQLKDSPIALGEQYGCVVADPVTGKFLLWGGGNNARQFYELDPTGSGTYTQLTGSRQPPDAGLHGVSDPSGGAGGPDAFVWCALPDHGVVAAISASGASYANVFLYKHA
jgi:hypothetical protein